MSLSESLKKLEGWFSSHARILPWRENASVYRVWVSEIMLQQTQVATVIPYFEKFMNRFPDLESLAGAEESEVLLYWAGLGYYSRAKNLLKTARILYASKVFPETRKEWLALPGVGHYTAGAVLSIAQNQPEAILDGNVERVLSRIRLRSHKKRLWNLSEIFVKQGFLNGIEPRITNQALMELGALICSPKNPRCGLCPLSKLCKALKQNRQHEFPLKRKRTPVEKISEQAIILVLGSEVYLEQKPAGSWQAGLWDFPPEFPEGFQSDDFKSVMTFSSAYTVTHHRITRLYEVFRGSDCLKKPAMLCGDFLSFSQDFYPLPLTSEAQRALSKITRMGF